MGTIVPGLLGHLTNWPGRVWPRTGWSQRNRHSTPVISPGVEPDQRLVVQRELVVVDGAWRRSDSSCRRAMIRWRKLHVEELPAAVAPRLGLDHRRVGLGQHRLGVLLARGQADPDAGRQGDALARQLEGPA